MTIEQLLEIQSILKRCVLKEAALSDAALLVRAYANVSLEIERIQTELQEPEC